MLKTKREAEVVWVAFFSKLSNEGCYSSINETINFTHLQTLIPLQITFKVHDFSSLSTRKFNVKY